MRVSGKNDFLILDAAFQPLKYVTVTNTPKIRCQSMDSDDKYIYICMDRAGSYNLIAVYGWDGTWKKTITVPLILEIESLYHIGKKTYAYDPNFNTSTIAAALKKANKYVGFQFTYTTNGKPTKNVLSYFDAKDNLLR